MQLKTLFTAIGVLFFTVFSSAQSKVLESDRSMSFGSRPCFRLEFGNTQADVVETLWKDFVKKNYNGKLKKDKKSGEWTATKLKAAAMGDDPFAIYSTIEKTNNGAALNIWYDAGSYFLSRRDNAGRTQEVVNRLEDFYVEVRREALKEDLEKEQDKLKDMESKQKKNQKDTDGLRKDIENYKAKIKKAEDDIAKNEKELEALLRDQEAQKRVIEDAKRRLDNVANEN